MADLSITPANVLAGADARWRWALAGETIVAGQVVYQAADTRRWRLADANGATAESRAPVGFAMANAFAGQPLFVQVAGELALGPVLTAGVAYYLSEVPGAVCPYADVDSDDYVILVGLAHSTTTLRMNLAPTGVLGGATPDTTAPVLSSPTGVQTGSTSANLGVTTSEAGGTLYWAVLPSASAAPSAAAFIAGTTGGAATGTGTPTLGANAFGATGLAASTAYKAHFFQRDAAGNDSNVVSSATFTTAAAADTTPPTLTSPTDAASGSTGGSLAVTTNEGNGTLYWFVSTSATPPSAAALKAGTGAASAGNQAVSGTGVQNATASGLTASTAYYTHFLHRDAAGNDSAIVSADGFTTAAGGGEPNNGELDFDTFEGNPLI